MHKKSFALTWCVLAVLVIAGILLVGERILVTEDAGELALAQRRAEYHTKGTYNDERLPELSFRQNRNEGLGYDVKAYFVENTIYCFFPQDADISSLVCHYSAASGALYYEGQRVISGFTRLDLAVQAPAFTLNGETFAVVVRRTQLPVLSISTYQDAPVYSLTQYVPGEATLWDENGEMEISLPVSVRVRGNLTALMPKLPYKMKSSVTASLLGLREASEWTLLANFLDPSMLRNQIGYELAEELGMDYVPQQRYVEVYLRGEYQGVYALGTQISLSTSSVDLPALHREDGVWVGSYIMEADGRAAETEEHYISAFDVPITYKDPADPSDAQRDEMLRDLQRFEACLLAEDFTADGRRYTDVIDVDSFARYYVLTEVIKNNDTAFPLSVYLYRDADGRLAIGPVWDMDRAFGNDEMPASEGFVIADKLWFGRLLQDGDFCENVMRQYESLTPYLDALAQRAAEYRENMAAAANNNFIVTYIGVNAYSNLPQDDPFEAEVAALLDWISARRSWLDANLYTLVSKG